MTVQQQSAEQAAKLLVAYISKFGSHLCDGRRILLLNTSSLRYINARIREWKRSLDNKEGTEPKAGLGTWLWNTFVPSNSLTDADLESLLKFFSAVPSLRVQGNRTESEIDLSLFDSLKNLEISNCNVVYAKGCQQLTHLHCIDSQVAHFDMIFYASTMTRALEDVESANTEEVENTEPSTDLDEYEDQITGALRDLTLSFTDYQDIGYMFNKWKDSVLQPNSALTQYLETLTVKQLTPVPDWYVPFDLSQESQIPFILKSPGDIILNNTWRNLTKLICTNCQLSFIVENPSLVDSYVVYNHGLIHAPNLKELILSHNQIQSVLQDPTNSVGDFDRDDLVLNVHTLDLSHNKLQTKAGSFRFFNRLFMNIRSLNLSNNQLSQISDICCLTMLQSLNLSHNNISDWSEVQNLEQLCELQELWLKGNSGLEANSNYRAYACGFFKQLPKLMFDGIAASAWELNYHANAYGLRRTGSLSESDADLLEPRTRSRSNVSSSSDDDSLVQSTLGVFIIPKMDPKPEPSSAPDEASSGSAAKSSKKKKKRRNVDAIPEKLVTTPNKKRGADLSDESVTSPTSATSDKKASLVESPLTPQPTPLQIVNLSKIESTAVTAQKHLEALKKDGGDQWLLILNEYMNDAKEKSTPRSPIRPKNIAKQTFEPIASAPVAIKKVDNRRSITISRSGSAGTSPKFPHVGSLERERRREKRAKDMETLENLIGADSSSSEDEQPVIQEPVVSKPILSSSLPTVSTMARAMAIPNDVDVEAIRRRRLRTASQRQKDSVIAQAFISETIQRRKSMDERDVLEKILSEEIAEDVTPSTSPVPIVHIPEPIKIISKAVDPEPGIKYPPQTPPNSAEEDFIHQVQSRVATRRRGRRSLKSAKQALEQLKAIQTESIRDTDSNSSDPTDATDMSDLITTTKTDKTDVSSESDEEDIIRELAQQEEEKEDDEKKGEEVEDESKEEKVEESIVLDNTIMNDEYDSSSYDSEEITSIIEDEEYYDSS